MQHNNNTNNNNNNIHTITKNHIKKNITIT